MCCSVKTRFTIILKLLLGNCGEQYILADNLLASLAMIELSACHCKTGCKTNCSKCRKNGFTCTDMCKCAQCENNDCWIEDKADDNQFIFFYVEILL